MAPALAVVDCESATRGGRGVAADDAIRLVNHFLRESRTAHFGPYEPEDGPDAELRGEELVPGHLYRFPMVRPDEYDGRQIDVQVFLGVGDLGGLMWEQDVRTLLRMAGTGNTAIPVVVDGGYRSAEETRAIGVDVGGVAFIATEGSGRVAGAGLRARLAERPREAVRQLLRLADGLAVMANLGITHRNVSPFSLDVHGDDELRLARFEMSALVNDMFRASLDSAAGPARLRELFAGDLARTLPYTPPERLAFLVGDERDGLGPSLVENERSDVYGLAAVAWEWFLGSPPTELLSPLPGIAASPAEIADFHRSVAVFNSRLRRRLLEADQVPADLATILVGMLAPNPDDRPSADQTVNQLVGAYDRIMATWDDPAPARPYALMFMPKESVETVFRWGWIDRHPGTPDGRRQLAEFIKDDIRSGFVVHSPDGADPFVDGGERQAKRNAKQVLLGTAGAWFCDLYRPEDDDGHLCPPLPGALVIKYVAQRSLPWVEHRLGDLGWRQGRRVPDVELVPTDAARGVIRRALSDRPAWLRLLESTTKVTTDAPFEASYRRAMDWLVDYQRTELDARLYPYLRVPDATGSEVAIRYDQDRDQRRIVSSPLFVKFAASPELRPVFGTFFDAVENDDGGSDVELIADHNGRPSRFRGTVRAELVRVEGQDRVTVKAHRGERSIPAVGWIRSSDDWGTESALNRQRDALYALYRTKPLLEQLHEPHTIRTLAHRWEGAGEELKGDGPSTVREMLVCQPFAAIQGPPGTGKTRVAAAAIAAYLAKEPTARILVSAQSNFALDNLAAAVLTEIGAMDETRRPAGAAGGPGRPIALRVTARSDSALDRVDDTIRAWTRSALATREIVTLRAHVASLAEAVPDPVHAVVQDWAALLDDRGESIAPELADRLHRGANLVFATCAAATPDLLAQSRTALFDWVIVEEAAKAWPTELAIPLVRGLRWTLIGDHKQLPAHRSQELERFLDSCVHDPHPDMAKIGDERSDYLAAFRLFASLFLPRERPRWRQEPPLVRMSVQFRMRPPLGDLVSRAFYPEERPSALRPADGLPIGSVSTFEDSDDPGANKRLPPVRFRKPTVLSGPSLVWLDTADVGSCRDVPRWYNPGEAAVVVELLNQMQPFPRPHRDGFGADPLAVLTPYRAQHQLLGGSSVVRDYLSTIHAFQGREADVVVVSLVRDTPRGQRPGDRAHGSARGGLGHLAQPELANVLFSRARRQLVVVGRFDHYASVMGDDGFWSRVCRLVEANGEVVSARDVVGDVPELGAAGSTPVEAAW